MKNFLLTIFIATIIAVSGCSFVNAQKIGDVIVGQYTYYDPEGDPEGQSLFQWYRDGVAIPGAKSQSYTIVAEDIGKTLVFEVIPVALTGISPGEPIRSEGIFVTGNSDSSVVESSIGGGVLPLPSPIPTSIPVITYVTSTTNASSSIPDESIISACNQFQHYLKLNSKDNDKEEVKLWQAFLNKEIGAKLPITGFFGQLTFNAIKAFQSKYSLEVLTPWDITSPTGYAYKSTRYKANKLLGCTEAPVTLDNGVIINY